MRPTWFLLGALLVSATGLAQVPRDTVPVSEFGKYSGYSEERFESWVVNSHYLKMRDGVRLAVDVVRPSLNGIPVEEPLPVVWTHSRYHRNPGAMIERMLPSGMKGPGIHSMVDAQADLQLLVRHGYVVVSVAVRGSGASFGRYQGLFSEAETRDAVEVIEWLAAQSWCDGHLGMYGGSYLGITQYMAASKHPDALKAIFPNVAALDMYDLVYPGGVYRKDLIGHWAELTRNLDLDWIGPRVATDEDGKLLEQAVLEHRDNWDVGLEYGSARYRDQASERLNWARHGPTGVLPQILEAEVPAYHFNGWFDVFATDAVLWFANYTGPQRLCMGAWSHAAMTDNRINIERFQLIAIEQHRWFDYWLKGIDNGVLDGPPIHYALMVAPDQWVWESADQWPPSTGELRLHLSPGPSGSIDSVNDGRLSRMPERTVASDRYPVDSRATTGTKTRWDNAVGSTPTMEYPDLSTNDRRGLTYTTDRLAADLKVIGHPVITLFLSASKGDADVHVYLEEVDDQNVSHYVTEAVLRASHRKLGQAPWDNLGLPYQRSNQADVEPLPADQAVELVMDLHPTATVFNAGHKLRITITGADADNTEPAPSGADNTLTLHYGPQTPSAILLPIK